DSWYQAQRAFVGLDQVQVQAHGQQRFLRCGTALMHELEFVAQFDWLERGHWVLDKLTTRTRNDNVAYSALARNLQFLVDVDQRATNGVQGLDFFNRGAVLKRDLAERVATLHHVFTHASADTARRCFLCEGAN